MLKIDRAHKAFLTILIMIALFVALRIMLSDKSVISYEKSKLSSRILEFPPPSKDKQATSDYEKESFDAFTHNSDINKNVEDIKTEHENEIIYIDEDMLK